MAKPSTSSEFSHVLSIGLALIAVLVGIAIPVIDILRSADMPGWMRGIGAIFFSVGCLLLANRLVMLMERLCKPPKNR